MSLEEIKKLLEGNEKADDIYDKVVTLVETEKQSGITAKQKVNREAKGLRDKIAGLEPFKAAVTDTLEFDPEGGSDLNDFLASLKSGAKETGDVADLKKQLSKQNKTLEKLTGDLAEKDKIATQLKQKQSTTYIKDKMLSALKNDDGSFKLYGTDLLVDTMIQSGKVGLEEDDKTVVFINGDDTVDFDSGIKSVIDSRPDLHRNQQRPGGGSPTGDPGANNMTDDQKRLDHLRKSTRFPV